jgi:hypothetical protein
MNREKENQPSRIIFSLIPIKRWGYKKNYNWFHDDWTKKFKNFIRDTKTEKTDSRV